MVYTLSINQLSKQYMSEKEWDEIEEMPKARTQEEPTLQELADEHYEAEQRLAYGRY